MRLVNIIQINEKTFIGRCGECGTVFEQPKDQHPVLYLQYKGELIRLPLCDHCAPLYRQAQESGEIVNWSFELVSDMLYNKVQYFIKEVA